MKTGWGLVLSAGLGILGGYLHGAEALSQDTESPLVVEVVGCDEVSPDGACQIRSKKTLQVWIKIPASVPVKVSLDAKKLHFSGVLSGDGLRAPVEVSQTNRRLSVEVPWRGGRAVHYTRIAPAPDQSLSEAVKWLLSAGMVDHAKALLNDAVRDPRPEVRVQALRKLARIMKDDKSTAASEKYFNEAIRLDRELGHVREEHIDRFALSDMQLFSMGSREDARSTLAPLKEMEAIYPEGRVYATYFRALIPYEQGDLDEALEFLRSARNDALRLGMNTYIATINQPLADVLSLLGRHEDAVACFDEANRILGGEPDSCRMAELLNNKGWTMFLRGVSEERLGELEPDVASLFHEALDLYRSNCPEKREDIANILTNLALVSAESGATGAARRYLDEARSEVRELVPRIYVWQILVEAKIAFKARRLAEALSLFEDVDRLGDEWFLDEVRFEAGLSRARVLEDLGRTEDAQRAYAEVESLLDLRTLRVPLTKGRVTLMDRLEKGMSSTVGFFVRQAAGSTSQPKIDTWYCEAINAVRRNRGRLLSALHVVNRLAALPPEERADWNTFIMRFQSARDELALDAARDSRSLAGDAILEARRRRQDVVNRFDEELEKRLNRLNLIERHSGRSSTSTEPCADLQELEEGEVMLLFSPVDRFGSAGGGWFGFAATPHRIMGQFFSKDELAMVSDEALPGHLLEPFRSMIGDAKQIRIAEPNMKKSQVDPICADAGALSAAPPSSPVSDNRWSPSIGDILLSSSTIVYGLDIPRSLEEKGRLFEAYPNEPPVAVVAVGKMAGLAGVRPEVEEVQAVLVQMGFRVERLEEERLTRAAILASLRRPEVELFHFAGHGAFDDNSPWNSRIIIGAPGPFADEEFISASDVLALGRVPKLVVLSACATVKTRASTTTAGLGVGQAFILAGANAVIASEAELSDQVATRVVTSFYRLLGLQREALASKMALGSALRAAHLQEWARASNAGANTQAPKASPGFRLLVP